jgi:hypothetical protein
MWSFTSSTGVECGSVRRVDPSKVHAAMCCVEKDYYELACMYTLQIPMYLVRGSTCRTKTLGREGYSRTDSLHLGTSYTSYRSPPCGAPMWRSCIRERKQS